MNATNAKDYLPLVAALARGETIQSICGQGWKDEEYPTFNFSPHHYRIKPKPLECWVSVSTHDGNTSEQCLVALYKTRHEAEAINALGRRVVHMREVTDVIAGA